MNTTEVTIMTIITKPTTSPVPPSPEEQRVYYFGLISRPRLVARSSTTPWVRKYDRESTLGKSIGLVGRNHPMIDLWIDSTSPLRQNINAILRGIDWTALEFLRIGYDTTYWTREEFEQPVTLMITVRKDSTSWTHAYAVVMACRAVIVECGIHDVHVEVKQPWDAEIV
ncbi:hypothetical protein LCI18_010280 [Fusarium solani-melongenae]|uniref:Uncharacterized protein n=1 Tax=Fusarium solani subsp. cucurbitae TaxID=2747967 RepID=A0ACD3ZDQ3_FUSSC|nr:hypothetical protein LCI18_010280 [Fusarium solani-melongenae]